MSVLIQKFRLMQGRRRRGGGGQGGARAPLPTFKRGGGTSGFVPPPHFWAEQMFCVHYLLIFCG